MDKLQDSVIKGVENETKRFEYIDALKGFAIFCVLWGHSIQYLKNGYNFFSNPVFEFIYSFHMPLFFMVSGFFFRSSLKLNLKNFLYKKGIQLLLPGVISAVMFCIIELSLTGINDIDNWLKYLYLSFPWFLRELFISYFIVYASLKILKKDWLACLLSICFVLSAPYCGFQQILLPVFWSGIYLKNNYQLILQYTKQILIISGIVFSMCSFLGDRPCTMYGYLPGLLKIFSLNDFQKIGIFIFRLLISFSGSLFWFMLFKMTYKQHKFFIGLGKIGINTLAIYLIQRLIIESLFNRIIDFPTMNIWIYSLIITLLIALGVLGFCIVIIKIVQKNKYAELLLFGKNK